MPGSQAKTWGLIALGVILALLVGAIIGFRIAVGILKDRVVEALGRAARSGTSRLAGWRWRW